MQTQPGAVEQSEVAVRDLFDQSVESYRRHFQGERSGKGYAFDRRRSLARLLTARCRGHLLDCAVGTGEVALAMLDGSQFERATLVDLSPKMLARSRELLSAAHLPQELQFVEASVFDHLVRTSDKYDFIACLGLIAHTGRLPELFSRMSRTLRPGGRLLLQSTLAEHWGAGISRWVGQLAGNRLDYAISHFTSAEIQSVARTAGFRLDRTVRFSAGLPFADRIWPRANHWLETIYESPELNRGAEGLFLFEHS